MTKSPRAEAAYRGRYFQPALAGGGARFSFRVPDVVEDLDLWTSTRNVILDFSRPGKPTDNAFIESLNDKFWAGRLNQHWFMSLDYAVRKCDAWRRVYNEVRPHSAIGNKPPISLVNRSAAMARRCR